MSAPFKKNLTIYQGATFEMVGIWKAGKTPVPVDLTGCKARAHIRADVDAPQVLLELTTENGRVQLGGATGTVTLNLSDSETAAINWPDGVYDLEVVFPSGFVRRLLSGGVVVSPEVTRGP